MTEENKFQKEEKDLKMDSCRQQRNFTESIEYFPAMPNYKW